MNDSDAPEGDTHSLCPTSAHLTRVTRSDDP